MANKMKYQNNLVLEIHDTLLKGQSSMVLRSLEFTKPFLGSKTSFCSSSGQDQALLNHKREGSFFKPYIHSLTIHVWYIYLHLPYVAIKHNQRQANIPVPWMIWDFKVQPHLFCKMKFHLKKPTSSHSLWWFLWLQHHMIRQDDHCYPHPQTPAPARDASPLWWSCLLVGRPLKKFTS